MSWEFFQSQILGMKWLNELIGQVLESFGLSVKSNLGGGMQFFIYDVIKISILLCVFIFIVAFIQSYFPPERSRRIMGRFRGIFANFIGALLGSLTPFCACSSIPIFTSFTSAGLPLGMTFSFLISSPMINPGSFALLMSVFGAKIAFIYVIIGFSLAVIGGIIIENLHMGKYVEEFVYSRSNIKASEIAEMTIKQRLKFARQESIDTFKYLFKYILIGVGIGAIIHNWIPENFIQSILGNNNPFGVFLAVLVGTPIYADIFGTIPIAEALLAKGAALGTILSFMMAVTDLSLPSLIMLRRVIKPRLLGTFIAICVIGIIIIGYVFNFCGKFFI